MSNLLKAKKTAPTLLRGLADAYLRAGDSKKALNVWMQFANQNDRQSNLAAQLIAFDLAMIADDLEVQTKTIERLKKIEEPEGSEDKKVFFGTWRKCVSS